MTKDKDKEVRDTKEGHDMHNYDTRIVERNMKRGLVSRKDYEKHLKSLPDIKEKMRPTGE